MAPSIFALVIGVKSSWAWISLAEIRWPHKSNAGERNPRSRHSLSESTGKEFNYSNSSLEVLDLAAWDSHGTKLLVGKGTNKQEKKSEIKKTATINLNTELKKKNYPADVKYEPILIWFMPSSIMSDLVLNRWTI